jgi:anti-sigma B factor antagonist
MDYNANIAIDVVEYGEFVVVAVEGDVDVHAAAVLEESLAAAGATDAATIIVDLERVNFMDSAGLHVLLQFSISGDNRARLALTRGSPQVRRLLEVTGVRRYLSFVESPPRGADALQAVGRLRLTG